MKAILATLFASFLLVGCASKMETHSVASRSDLLKDISLEGNKSTVAKVSLDEQDRKIMDRISPRTVERMDKNEPLTISDVIKLSQAGVADEMIIGYISDTNTRYNLSQVQLRRLQQGGVSQRVVNHIVDKSK